MCHRSDPPRSKIAHVDTFPPNKRNFTGLRFEVEQASRSLSAIAELLVVLVLFSRPESSVLLFRAVDLAG